MTAASPGVRSLQFVLVREHCHSCIKRSLEWTPSQPASGNDDFTSLRNLMDLGSLLWGFRPQRFFDFVHSILARPALRFFAPSDHLPIVYIDIDYPARF